MCMEFLLYERRKIIFVCQWTLKEQAYKKHCSLHCSDLIVMEECRFLSQKEESSKNNPWL